MEFGGGGCKSTAGKEVGREKCGESEWIRGKRREGETKVLREGSERQIEAWGGEGV